MVTLIHTHQYNVQAHGHEKKCFLIIIIINYIVCCWFIIWRLACYEKGLKDSVVPDPGSRGGGRGSANKKRRRRRESKKKNKRDREVYHICKRNFIRSGYTCTCMLAYQR